jgi:polysaccharide biosynthesis/export protein
MLKNKTRSLFLAIIFALGMSQSIRAQQAGGDTSKVKPCVVVFGAVRKPARLELRQPMRLVDVITLVGGISELAGETIQIVHTGLDCYEPSSNDRARTTTPAPVQTLSLHKVLRGDKAANLSLQPGDIVIVHEAPRIYVLGSVTHPGTIYLRESLTLTQAIALVGGVLPNTKTDQIRIYRTGVDSSMSVITVDLTMIEQHRTKDVTLQPSDLVHVPEKTGNRRSPSQPIYDPPMKLGTPLRVIAGALL